VKIKVILKYLAALIICISFDVYPQGYICAVGGGSEDYNDWSDAPYSWIVQKADSGKILVLSYDDETEWIPDYFKSLGASEVKNLKISSRTLAEQQSTYNELITANAVFIKGGDQYRYITLWKGTKTEEAIKYIFNNGGVIAGTSAGEALLGEFIFSAKNGSSYPDEALKNPFNNDIVFETNFLKLIPGVLFDSHFIERGRFGRLLPMMLNIKVNFTMPVTAIGIDDHTAFCINPDLTATVMGSGAVAVFYSDQNTVIESSSRGYIIDNLLCDQLTDGWQYNIKTHSIIAAPLTAKPFYSNNNSFPVTSFMLTGNASDETISNSVAAFLSGKEIKPVLILTHSGYSAPNSKISATISSLGYPVSVLNINSTSLTDEASSESIKEASYYTFSGDSPGILNLLSNYDYKASAELKNAFLNNKPALFIGNSGKLAGDIFVDNTDEDDLASWYGRMKISSSLALYNNMVFQPLLFEDSDFYENRTSAVLWGMMRNRKIFGVYLNNNDLLNFNAANSTVSGTGDYPFVIINAQNTTLIDSSVYKAGSGTRQIVAMNNLRYSVSSRNDLYYSLSEGSFINTVSVNKNAQLINTFTLSQNYPNPFNPETNFTFYLSKAGFVDFRLYNVMGEEISVIIQSEMQTGRHDLSYRPDGLASGVYFAKMRVDNFTRIIKLCYIK